VSATRNQRLEMAVQVLVVRFDFGLRLSSAKRFVSAATQQNLLLVELKKRQLKAVRRQPSNLGCGWRDGSFR